MQVIRQQTALADARKSSQMEPTLIWQLQVIGDERRFIGLYKNGANNHSIDLWPHYFRNEDTPFRCNN